MKGPAVGPRVLVRRKEVADACTRLWAQHYARGGDQVRAAAAARARSAGAGVPVAPL